MTRTHAIASLLVVTLIIQVAILVRLTGRSSGKPPKEDYFVVPDVASLDITGMPFVGLPKATLAIVEFSDFECAYCQRHARTVLPALRVQFVESGTLRYVFGNLPLRTHPNAIPFAKAASCAGRQNQYSEMHDRLFAIPMPGLTTEADLHALARALPLDQASFAKCYGGSEGVGQIAMDLKKAEMLGITTTPTFVVGRIALPGLLTPKAVIRGSRPLSVFEEVIRTVHSMQQ